MSKSDETRAYVGERTWPVPVPNAVFTSLAKMKGVVSSIYAGRRRLSGLAPGDKVVFYPDTAYFSGEEVPRIERYVAGVHTGGIEQIVGAMPVPAEDLVPAAAVLRGVQSKMDVAAWYRAILYPLPKHQTVGFTFQPGY